MEKSDHTLAKGKLQSTQIPEEKWSEISIDFITDLPMSSRNKDTILTVVDKATRMVHLAPCRKNITATVMARLLWSTVVKLHGIPRVIYSDRGAQFTANSWQELWRLMGTKLGFSTAYHPQTQGVVERMNAVVSQTLRCLIHEKQNLRDWEFLLPTVEMSCLRLLHSMLIHIAQSSLLLKPHHPLSPLPACVDSYSERRQVHLLSRVGT